MDILAFRKAKTATSDNTAVQGWIAMMWVSIGHKLYYGGQHDARNVSSAAVEV
jgi:hypothetical protein